MIVIYDLADVSAVARCVEENGLDFFTSQVCEPNLPQSDRRLNAVVSFSQGLMVDGIRADLVFLHLRLFPFLPFLLFHVLGPIAKLVKDLLDFWHHVVD